MFTRRFNHMAAALSLIAAAFPGINEPNWRQKYQPPEPTPWIKSRPPKKGRRFKRIESGGQVDSVERQRFIAAHNRNAMNFLPGAVAASIYARYETQKQVEREADKALANLIARGFEPKPGYTGP